MGGCLAVLAPSAMGCAHGAAASSASARQDAARPEAKASDDVRAQLAERDRRITQLENRLALIEAEQRQLRFAIAESQQSAPGIHDTVRIGRSTDEGLESDGETTRHESAKRKPPLRPVLRLYEAHGSPSADEALLPVPEVSERLPVAPLPGSLPAALQAPPAVSSADDASVLYRRAIDLVRQRQFDEALIALNEFLRRHADDARAQKAMFWRGELLFAQRDYERALEAFEAALARDPRGDKAADALLKIGLCHKRLGAPERARAAIERLKTQFPNSDAARLATEEDA